MTVIGTLMMMHRSLQDADQLARMGADIIVTGSAVFDGKDPAGNARVMLNAVKMKGGPS